MSKMAFIFPGQGSQSIGMLTDLASAFPIVQQRFAEASEQLHKDLWSLTQTGPAETLNQTENTQVIMLLADVVIYEILQANRPIEASMMAGHSLGEYPSLVCAGALSLANAVELVQQRAKLMQEAVPLGQGAMAAIVGLDEQTVEELCSAASDESHQVMPANYNAIGQIVIAGHALAVDRAIKLAEAKEARLATRLAVSVPCHCSLLQGASEHFAATLEATEIHLPRLPVISNVNAKPYTQVEEIKTRLAEQLYSPVRWVETIQYMINAGNSQYIESGPGKVLTGLCKRIDRSINSLAVNDQASLSAYFRLIEEQSHA